MRRPSFSEMASEHGLGWQPASLHDEIALPLLQAALPERRTESVPRLSWHSFEESIGLAHCSAASMSQLEHIPSTAGLRTSAGSQLAGALAAEIHTLPSNRRSPQHPHAAGVGPLSSPVLGAPRLSESQPQVMNRAVGSYTPELQLPPADSVESSLDCTQRRDRNGSIGRLAGCETLASPPAKPWQSAVSHLLRDAILQAFDRLHVPLPQMSSQALLAMVRDFERKLLHFEVSWQSDPDRCTQCAQHVCIMLSELESGRRCLVPVTPSVDLPVPVQSLRIQVSHPTNADVMPVVNWPREFEPHAKTIAEILAAWDTVESKAPHVELWELFRHAVGSGGSVLRWSLSEVQRFGRFVFREHGLPPLQCPNEVWYQLFRQCDGSALTTLDFAGALSFARHLLETVLSFHRTLPQRRCDRSESPALSLRAAVDMAAVRSAAAAVAATGLPQLSSLRLSASPALPARRRAAPAEASADQGASAELPASAEPAALRALASPVARTLQAPVASVAPSVQRVPVRMATPPELQSPAVPAEYFSRWPTSPASWTATSISATTSALPVVAPTAQLLPMPAFMSSTQAAACQSRTRNTSLPSEIEEVLEESEHASQPNTGFADPLLCGFQNAVEIAQASSDGGMMKAPLRTHVPGEVETRMEAAVEAMNRQVETVNTIKSSFDEQAGSQRAVCQEVATLHASIGMMQEQVASVGRAMGQLARIQGEVAQLDASHQSSSQTMQTAVASLDHRLSSIEGDMEGKATVEQLASTVASIEEQFAAVSDQCQKTASKQDIKLLADNISDQLKSLQLVVDEHLVASEAEMSNASSQVLSLRDQITTQLTDIQGELSSKINRQQLDDSVATLEEQLSKACAHWDGKASRIEEDQKRAEALLEQNVRTSETRVSSFQKELACIHETINDQLSCLQSSVNSKACREQLTSSVANLEQQVAAAQAECAQKASVKQLQSAVDIVKEQLRCAQLQFDEKAGATEMKTSSLQQQLTCVRDQISHKLSAVHDAMLSKPSEDRSHLVQELATEVNDVKEQLSLAQHSFELKSSASEAQATRVHEQLTSVCACINDRLSCLQEDLNTKACKLELCASMDRVQQEMATTRAECDRKASVHRLESVVDGMAEQLRSAHIDIDQKVSASEDKASSVQQQLACIRDSINEQLSCLQHAVASKACEQQLVDFRANVEERLEAAHAEICQKPSTQQLEGAVGNLKEQLQVAQGSFDQKVAASEAELCSVKSQLAGIREDVDMQLAELRLSCGSKASKQELASSLASFEEQIAVARAEWCQQESSAEELGTAVNKMREQVRDVQFSFNEKVSELEAKTSNVHEQLTSIRSGIQQGESAIHWNINSMQASQAGLEEQVETAISTIHKQLGVIHDIQCTIDEFTGSQHAVKAGMDDLESSMTSMQTRMKGMHEIIDNQLADIRSTMESKAGKEHLESCKVSVEQLLETAQVEFGQRKSVEQLEIVVDTVKEEVRRAQVLFDEKVSALEAQTSSVQEELVSLCDDLQSSRSQAVQPREQGTPCVGSSEQNAVWLDAGSILDTTRLSLISSSLEALQAELAADACRQGHTADVASHAAGSASDLSVVERTEEKRDSVEVAAAAGLATAGAGCHGEAELAQVDAARGFQELGPPRTSTCRRTEWYSLASPAHTQGSQVSRHSSPDRGADFTSQWISGAITLSAADESQGGAKLAACSRGASQRGALAICGVAATAKATREAAGAARENAAHSALAQRETVDEVAAAAKTAAQEADAAANECSFFGGVLGQLRALEGWVDGMREDAAPGIGEGSGKSSRHTSGRELRARLTAGRALSALCEALPVSNTPPPVPGRGSSSISGAADDYTPTPEPPVRSRQGRRREQETMPSGHKAGPVASPAWVWPEIDTSVGSAAIVSHSSELQQVLHADTSTVPLEGIAIGNGNSPLRRSNMR